MKPIFLLALKQNSEQVSGRLCKSLKNLFTSDLFHTKCLVSDVIDDLQDEDLFQKQCDIKNVVMEDAMNAARGLITCFSKQNLHIANQFAIQINKPYNCSKCQMTFPQDTKISYCVCDLNESPNTFCSVRVMKHLKCPNPKCSNPLSSKICWPNFLVFRCTVIDMYITLNEVTYQLSGVVRSSGTHATCYVRYGNSWYYFDDSEMPKSSTVNNVLSQMEGYSIRGAYYVKQALM